MVQIKKGIHLHRIRHLLKYKFSWFPALRFGEHYICSRHQDGLQVEQQCQISQLIVLCESKHKLDIQISSFITYPASSPKISHVGSILQYLGLHCRWCVGFVAITNKLLGVQSTLSFEESSEMKILFRGLR